MFMNLLAHTIISCAPKESYYNFLCMPHPILKASPTFIIRSFQLPNYIITSTENKLAKNKNIYGQTTYLVTNIIWGKLVITVFILDIIGYYSKQKATDFEKLSKILIT